MKFSYPNYAAATALAVAFFASLGQALFADNLGSWENTHYIRSIDLSRAYVKETDSVQVKNVGEDASAEYYYAVNDGFESISNIAAITFRIDQGSRKIEVPSLEVEPKLFKLTFPVPIAPNSVVELTVTYMYIDALNPLPAQIKMDDAQQLLVQVNKFPFSPYTTKEYSLTFSGIRKGQEMQLFNVDAVVSENVPELKPRVDNKVLVYGPVLEDIEPFTVVPMGLHYDHQRPLTHVENLNRSIWIPASDVEQLPVEEYYELTNNGAALSTGFSRVDWMKGRYDPSTHWALSQLSFPYSKDNSFDDYYYSDLVGVVSTHQVISDNLVLVPRYPIFGGWHYNFTLGWNYKLSNFVHRVSGSDDTYIARVPLVNSLRDVTYSNAYLSFYLPEHAEFVNVSSPIAFKSLKVDEELSYLDVSGGHVKVTLHYENAFDAFNALDVFVQYKYTKANYLFKILKISGFAFAGLVSYYLLGLVDLSIDKKA